MVRRDGCVVSIQTEVSGDVVDGCCDVHCRVRVDPEVSRASTSRSFCRSTWHERLRKTSFDSHLTSVYMSIHSEILSSSMGSFVICITLSLKVEYGIACQCMLLSHCSVNRFFFRITDRFWSNQEVCYNFRCDYHRNWKQKFQSELTIV